MENVLVNEQSLIDIAEAIRNKNKTDETYTPGEMAAAIGELKTELITEDKVITENGIYTPGDGVDGFREVAVDVTYVTEPLEVTQNGVYELPEGVDGFSKVTVETAGVEMPPEAFEISGSCNYRFANNGWDWYIDLLGDKITTKDITDTSWMFSNTGVKEIPFDINVKDCQNFQSIFTSATKLTVCPKIRGTVKWSVSTTFDTISTLENLRYADDFLIPEMLDGFSTVKVTSAYSCPKAWRFDCYKSLRSIPEWWYKFKLNPESTVFPANSYTIYNRCFTSNYCLDEVLNIPVWDCQGAQTSNMFSNTFDSLSRAKNITFETNEDGTSKTAKWKSQVIDLSKGVGYSQYTNIIPSEYNSGITADMKIVTHDDYVRLKDNPDSWTMDINYSRYNRTSALATINSLPDTSAYLATAGGTNTIKFKDGAGDATDAGSCSFLMDTEIAVATAKGWTVTFAV